MKGFNAKFIDELKNKCDIIDIVKSYIHLEQKGSNFWGKCPFHHEKTASFCVNAIGQFYYCFGCHKSGDVISFVMEMESLDFGDAVKLLAEKVHLPIPEVEYDDERAKEQKKKRERVLELLKDSAYFYVNNLKSKEATKHIEYVVKRGIKGELVSKFGIGASLDFQGLVAHLKQKGYTEEEMLSSGVVDKKNDRLYDALAGRLIIPIINAMGQVVAFGGRLLENADFAKYKNTKETIAFSKSNTLYNLNLVKKLKNEKGIDSIIIVEGYMDTISLVSGGFENVVASMGTSLTKDQARILKRYTDKVFISYDGDFAGQKASIRGLEILKEEGLDVKVVALPDGLDPDDVIKKYGKEGYAELLQKAKPLIDFKLDIIKNTFDINSVSGKRKYVLEALKVIKESPSASEQEDLLKQVRDITGITYESLKRDLMNTEEKPQSKEKEVVPIFNDNVGDKLLMAERFIIYAYLFNKAYAEEENIEKINFTNPAFIEIKKLILDRKAQDSNLKFNDLYELLNEEFRDELSRIAGMNTEEDGKFNEEHYFNGCLKTVAVEKINTEIATLTKQFKEETDTVKRKELAKKMAEAIALKNKL